MTQKHPNGGYALITGGSEGIGFAIAAALARRGLHLLLVALPDDKLVQSASSLRKAHGRTVHTLGIDLRNDGADQTLVEWVDSLGVRVSVLVNNAGFGHLGCFEHYDRGFYHGLLQVNMVNLVGITRMMLEKMRQEESAYVLNVGSIASFFPIPYKTVYAASKYFVYAFSRGLREELRNTSVRVSLLCPGPVLTNEGVKARISYSGRLGRLMALTPEVVGEKGVAGMFAGQWLILPGASSRLALLIRRTMPGTLLQKLLARGFRKDKDAAQI
jgi:uncharacterized protein